MLDLTAADVLYLDAKVLGSYMLPRKEKACRRMGGQRELSPATEEFLRSKRWKEACKLEQMLWDAVNRSLDLTIDDAIGRDAFEARLREFVAAKALVRDRCADTVMTECTADGKLTAPKDRTKCYSGGVGCGYECVDAFFPFV